MLSIVAKRRLATLIDYMAQVPKEYGKHFHMKAWVMHNGNWSAVIGVHGIKRAEDIDERKLIECGMSACALGWGATIPAFKRAGLQLQVRQGLVGHILEPVYRGARDMDAAKTFFRIDDDQVERLFGPGNKDATQRAWAKRARKLVRRWSQ